MADTTVQLGSFVFQGFEVPESIPFAGEQSLGVHRLPGGKKRVDALGYFPDDISWSGRFRGPSAVSRAQTVQAMVKAGQQVSLSWGALSFLVVPKHFAPDYQRAYEIPYSLTLEVVSDQTSPLSDASQTTVDSQVSSDMASASTLSASVGDAGLTSSLATLQSAISAVPTFAAATNAQLTSVLNPLSSTLSTVGGLLATNNAAISGLSTFGGLVAGGNPAAMAASLLVHSTAISTVASLTSLQSLLTRIQTNLLADGASGTTQTTTSNLYELAAEAYGDPSEWTTIAEANGLTDPMVTGVNTLVIPAQPLGTDGVWPT